MPVFLVLSEEDKPELATAIQEKFKDKWYALKPASQWLLDAEKTTTEVMEELDLGGGEKYGGVAVFLVTNWAGYHNKNLWEWLELD